MSQETDKIKIKTTHTHGGGNDGNDLKNCYFLPTNVDGQYVFFDPTGLPIVTNPMPLIKDLPFTFNLPGDNLTWRIPNPAPNSEAFSIKGRGPSATAKGSWANSEDGAVTASVRDHHTPSLGIDPTGESGTFQAAAGQTMDPEDPEGEDAAHAAKA
jgi:hypothetical protein